MNRTAMGAAIFDLTSSPFLVDDRWRRGPSVQLGRGRRGRAPLCFPSAAGVRMAASSSAVDAATRKRRNPIAPPSPLETRLSLVAALAFQSFSVSQRRK